MASTYQSDQVNSGVPARDTTGVGVVSKSATYELTAALVDADVIEMVTVPANCYILDVILTTEDLDTGGSPALSVNVGDDDDVDRFIAASLAGQAGGMTRLNNPVGVGHLYEAENTIDVHVETAPATGAAEGAIRLQVLYTMDD